MKNVQRYCVLFCICSFQNLASIKEKKPSKSNRVSNNIILTTLTHSNSWNRYLFSGHNTCGNPMLLFSVDDLVGPFKLGLRKQSDISNKLYEVHDRRCLSHWKCSFRLSLQSASVLHAQEVYCWPFKSHL